MADPAKNLAAKRLAASDGPWEQNACFTIKAESEEKVNEIATKLDAYARRIGAGAMFCDYSGPSEGAVQ